MVIIIKIIIIIIISKIIQRNREWMIMKHWWNENDRETPNKLGIVGITWHWGAFMQPMMQWKSNVNYYKFRVSEWMSEWERERERERESVCVALVTQQAKRMRRIIMPSVACPALSIFFHTISKPAGFSGGITGHKMVFVFLCKFCLKPSHSKKNSATCYHIISWNLRRCYTNSTWYIACALSVGCTSPTPLLVQPTDITHTQYTKCRLWSTSWGWASNARNM
jgi:multisubunit Na+/H+ antiporter MnhB subunit